MIEGKAKASEPEEVLDYVLKKFGLSSKLHGKKILITAGPTIEQIDPIRAITNQSSGKTGVSLAKELVSSGAKVTFVYGPGNEKPPKGAKIINVITSKEMHTAVKKELKNKFDIVIMAAAISDYVPKNPQFDRALASVQFPEGHWPTLLLGLEYECYFERLSVEWHLGSQDVHAYPNPLLEQNRRDIWQKGKPPVINCHMLLAPS